MASAAPVEMSVDLQEQEFLKHQSTGKPEATERSVALITFHKCASSYLACVLKNCRGLSLIDYESRVYSGGPVERYIYREYGYGYGSLRITPHHADPSYHDAVSALIADESAQSIRKVFIVRDPRDLIVSMYYSFGFTHPFSPVESIRKRQESNRDRIQSLGLDGIAHEWADGFHTRFRIMKDLISRTPDRLILRYEDMIDNFDRFYCSLNEFLPLNSAFRQELFEQTRPRNEEVLEHRRNGRTEQFRDKLNPSTIAALNETFAEVLDQFGYER